MKLSHLLLATLPALPLPAQTLRVNGFNAGSPSQRLEPGQAATRTFTGNFYQPGGTGGQTIANVNTFTGQPAYAVPLYTLDARGEVAFPFSLSFSGPTFPTIENNNDRAPAGWIGVGWSMQAPFVAINHKGTLTYSDDMIFCSLGPYGGGQILWQPETKRFYVATAPGIVVTADTVWNPASPLYRQIKAWSFVIPATGVRLVFGDAGSDTVVNSQRYLQHQGAMILASSYSIDSAKPFIYRWDLRRLEDASGRTGLDFEYDRLQEPLWGGKGYTRESYLKRAAWHDEHGNEIRRVDLELDTLQPGEYAGYLPGEAKTSQRTYETRCLKSLSVYDEGGLRAKYRLTRSVRNLDYGKKAVLDSVTPGYGPGEKRGPGWAFTYRDGDLSLQEIITPAGTRERYEYQTLDLGATLGSQEGNRLFRDTSGNVVNLSNNGDGWRVEARCDDRFCYETLRNDLTSPDKVYFQVIRNTGNYFEEEPVLNRILQDENTGVDEWQLIPMGDYVLIANGERAYVELWEWDGRKFARRNDGIGEPGDPMRGHFGLGDVYTDITVRAGGPNFFLVYRNREDGSLKRRVWVYLKDPATGKWNNLTTGLRGSPGCRFENSPKPDDDEDDGGPHLRDPRDGDSCFTWKSDLTLVANSRMFAIREAGEDLVYLYALNAAGDGFDSIGQLLPQIPGGMQEVVSGNTSVQNWKYPIRDLRLEPDFLAIKASDGDNSRYDFLSYDGRVIHAVGSLGWEDDEFGHEFNATAGSSHDRNIWFAPDYFIHVNTNPGERRVEYWRKRQNADSMYFEKAATVRTDPPHEKFDDVRVSTGSRFFSIEYYDENTFVKGMDPYNYPNFDGAGSINSWLYRINDTAGVEPVPDSTFTLDYEGCGRKAWNLSFSGIDNVMMGTVHKAGSGCEDCTVNCKVKNVSFKTNLLSNRFSRDSITDPINSASHQVKMKDRSWSLGDRLGMSMFIKYSSDPDSLIIRRYFYNGRSYGDGLSTEVVRRFVREASSDGTYPPEITEFDFTPPVDAFVTEFNHNALTPQFEYAGVTRKGAEGKVLYSQFVDHAGYKLLLDSAGLAGRVRSVTTVDGAGDTIAESFSIQADPYAKGWLAPGHADASVAAPWPQGVAMNRLKETVTRQRATNGSYQTLRGYPRVWSDELETPLFTVTAQGARRAVTQIVLDTSGTRVNRTFAYDYPATDSAALSDSALELHRDHRLSTNVSRHAVATTKVEYDSAFPYKIDRVYGWRDPGGVWNEEELKTGPLPDFNPDSGLFVASEVTRRDDLGLPLEMLSEDGDAQSRVSVFYEGRAVLPVGRITGSGRDNSAVLTAENGDVPQLLASGKLDRDGRWDAPGVTYDSVDSHTGRYSFRVTDNFGPSCDLRLQSVREGKFGFIASAWIRSEGAEAPIFSISWRRGSDGADVREVRAAPVEPAYARGKWQRWEARIPHDSLIAGGRFEDGSGDYLRFFIGPGSPESDPSRIIHVDDIVLRPDNSVFSLTAYDMSGRPTHQTDTHHRTITFEYGFDGRPVAARDEHGRIFEQTGFNKPGEN